ncbi:MAG: ComEA family DNA-binding protein [Actinomycetes bacterium]
MARTKVNTVVTSRLNDLLGERRGTMEPIALEPALTASDTRSAQVIAKWVGVAAAVLGLVVWLNRPAPMQSVQVTAPGISLATSAPVLDVVVDIEGDVRTPGLVHLPAGSRVADAIQAAGGLTRASVVGQLNLAQRLDDGQLIVVGQAAAGTSSGDPRVNLNSATVTDFDTLPGVGPVLASRIVAWRDQHHRFSSIDELQEVPGIGPKVFANLKALVRV